MDTRNSENSENSTTSNLHKLLHNLTNKINLPRGKKCSALLNISSNMK